MRKMASVRRISSVEPIRDADNICLYHVDGWQVVDRVGQYEAGDYVVFCEIDSWIPHDLAPFLSKGKEPKEYKGVDGNRLRTVKLRGAISQGLIISIDSIGGMQGWELGDDVSVNLNIQKWEQEIPAQLRGQMKGGFPSFIPKTDQERVQNMQGEIDKWKSLSLTPKWEVTEKLDGSSMTVYVYGDDSGVCSRNIDLKETEDNSFWVTAKEFDLIPILKTIQKEQGRNLAFQGELCGPGIQGNKYKRTNTVFYLYDVWDIDNQSYLTAEERHNIVHEYSIPHVPLLGTLEGVYSIEEYLAMAEGISSLNDSTTREGIVLKNTDNPFISFKAISNKFLLKEK